MNKITITCPSRARPQLFQRYLQSILDTARHPERIEILSYLDNDDPCRMEYISLAKLLTIDPAFQRFLNIEFLGGDRIGALESANVLAKHGQGNIIMAMNDDVIIRTEGWDIRIDQESAKYPDQIYVMYFNDGEHGEDVSAFPIVSRRWFEALNSFLSPLFFHYCADLWLQDLANRLGRRVYIGDVLAEHMNPEFSKGEKDQTYHDLHHQSKLARDWLKYRDFERYRELDAAILRKLLGTKP